MTVEYDHIYPNMPKAKVDALRTEAGAILNSTDVPSELSKQRARLRDLSGVTVYKGTESRLLSSLNAHDHVTHLGWSYLPTPGQSVE